MAEIAPFQGLRYDLTRVGDAAHVLAPPYDVISDGHRLELEARHSHNVVRLELPTGDGDARYKNAAGLLDSWVGDGMLRRDTQPALYRYEQTFRWPHDAAGETQTFTRKGFIALVKLEPFENRVVLPHEHTLSAPKEDRRKLLRATSAHISPIFGLYRDPEGASEAPFAAVEATAPAVDATTADGCRHRLWALTDRASIARVAEVMRGRQILIADGHHRYETMLSMREELRPRGRPPGRSTVDWGKMFLARAEDPGLLVLPTHRLVRNLPNFNMVALRAAARPAFEIWQTADGVVAPGEPVARLAADIEARLRREGHKDGRQRVVFAIRGAGEAETTWLALRDDVDLSALGPPALSRLDVTVLHGVLLAPLLGIDAGAMAKQSYLGYTHSGAEAVGAVAAGEAQGAFMMNATRVEDVLQACEAGFVLPQKSTYFQPKLATGLVINRIDPHAEIHHPR